MSYDPYVNILTVDASGVRLADLPANPVITSIHPIFASQGRDNKCLPFGSLSAVLAEYGEDMLNPIMYDQQGLNVKQVVSGGGVAYVCRLMPTNAKKASIVLQVHVKEEADMPVYQRNTFGSFFLDEHGNKVPLMQEIENEEGEPESVPVVKDGYKIIVTCLDTNSKKISEICKVFDKICIVFGNEGQGVDQEILALSDEKLMIEMANIDSLNVAVSAGIILYSFKD